MPATDQKYSQYVDSEGRVIKRPEGPGWSDPFGDDVWRSSWFYASLLVIKGKDSTEYDALKSIHGLDDALPEQFLQFFESHCTGADAWSLPKNPSQKFSGDQLAPLLYLFASTHLFGSDAGKSAAQSCLAKLIDLDKTHAAISDSMAGQIRDNQRYSIDFVCRMYGLDYLRGIRRDVCKLEFSVAISSSNWLAQLPWQELATRDDFSVFNALAIVSSACLKWGKDDEDVDTWRKNYRVHADKGWGPAFRITSGRSIDQSTIDDYKSAVITRVQDNDIIMAQRPSKYLSGDFRPNHDSGIDGWLVLDYVILRGLQLVWL